MLAEVRPELASVNVPPGTLIGERFEILERLGRGAMGEVHRAKDTRTGHVVALKRMISSETDGAHRSLASSLFEREYHALSALNHPCIVSVMDYGLDEDGPYYTMELLDGEDLRDLGRVPWRRACELLRDVASALAILHSRKLLHCDLSIRNVRCTTAGRAKLIDFGTMTPMGVAKLIAGTPPFVSPEVLQHQTLDARADLFSLGAMGYWMLTSRHAYPARSLERLPQIWKRPPLEPREIEPTVPEALSRLLMELLRLDRMARPPSAAAVMERLCAIADLPMAERSDVMRAYLTMPSLVGREEQLALVRDSLARERSGAAILVAGDAGVGRSRFLDACVLEGKLLGKTVLPASAGEAGGGHYAAVRLLAEHVLREAPDLARRAAAPWRERLVHAIPSLGSNPDPSRPPERRHLQSALREWFLSVARKRPLVIAIDDFERIDEPSAAVIAALARQASRRDLSVIVTMAPASSSPAARILSESATKLSLLPLTLSETEALVRSVFGDADNVAGIAHHLHDLGRGSPRAIMDLAQDLVDRNLARYEAGSWLLPRRLTSEDLRQLVPAARVLALGARARELGAILSLTDALKVPVIKYPELLGVESREAYEALDELVRAGVLVASLEFHRFSHWGWKEALAAQLEGTALALVHGRLARYFEAEDDPIQSVEHLLEAGDYRRAVDLALANSRRFALRPEAPAILERALAVAERVGVSRSQRIRLSVTLVGSASVFGEVERFWRHAPELLSQLKKDSGLEDWAALTEEGIPEAERLMQAFARVGERFSNAPEEERGLPLDKAIRQLARVSSAFSSMASISMDAKPLLALPSFKPLCALAPPLVVLDDSMNAVREFLTSHGERARAAALGVVARLDCADASGVDDAIAGPLRFGMLYMVGAMDAFDGLPNAAEHVEGFEDAVGYRGNAWRVRRVAHMMQGDFAAADEAQRRAELLELSDGEEQAFPGTAIRIEAAAHWMVGDLVRLKESMERIASLAGVFSGWRNTLAVVRSHYRRLQGDAAGALEAILPALENTEPGKDPDWPWVVAAHVHALVACERHVEAAELGAAYYATGIREGLVPLSRCLVRPLSEAYLKAGRHEKALDLVDGAIKEAEAAGVRGLWLGGFYESRAYVAIAMGDQASFEAYAQVCAEEYRRGKNSTLVASYERLMETAVRHSLGVSDDLERAVEWTERTQGGRSLGTTAESVVSRMAACATRAERVECALAAILVETGATAGHLFVLGSGALEHAASLPRDFTLSSDVSTQLQTYLTEQRTCDPRTATFVSTEATDHTTPFAGDPTIVTEAGHLRGTLVLTEHEGDTVIAAVAALAEESTQRSASAELLRGIGRTLIKSADTVPISYCG